MNRAVVAYLLCAWVVFGFAYEDATAVVPTVAQRSVGAGIAAAFWPLYVSLKVHRSFK